MVPTSPISDSALDIVVGRYESLLGELTKTTLGKDEHIRELLLVRDRIVALLRQHEILDSALLTRISSLDLRLRNSAKLRRLYERPGFADFRSLVNPPRRNWWWYPPATNPLWTVAALFLLTTSVSILADFTRRLLNSGPDEVGLLSIGVQGLFAVGATSTFTNVGRQWIEGQLSRFHIPESGRPAIKLWATLILFTIVFSAWKFLPRYLADHYNTVAFQQRYTWPDIARDNYAKAISLNPKIPEAHYNLGALYENAYEYDKAAAEYRKTIVVDPSHVIAYSNLSRLLLMQNDPSGALQILDDALKLRANVPLNLETTAALHRNRALAEYQLGFYSQAEADANLSSEAMPTAAAPYCVLAKIYTKIGRPTDAGRAWKSFLTAPAPPLLQPRIEPDCIHLAQEAIHEIK